MKKNKITKSLFLAFSLTLTFVFAGSVSAQDTVNYSCGSGTPLRVVFQGPESVRINFDGAENVTLRRAESGSGAKYTGRVEAGAVTFFTQGKEAILTLPGFNGKCRETSSGGGDSSSGGGGETVRYMCSQTEVMVTFLDGGNRVRVMMDADSPVLRRVRSGSGSKYTGKGASGTMTFWVQGKEATLTTPGFDASCTEQR